MPFISLKDSCKYLLVYPARHIALMLEEEMTYAGEQGWRSAESARLPPMWPGLDSRTRRHCLVSNREGLGTSL